MNRPLGRPEPSPRAVRASRAAAGRLGRLARAIAIGVGTGVGVIAIAVLVREQWPPLVALDERAVAAGTALAGSHPALLRVLLGWQWVFLASHMILPVTGLVLLYWRRTRDTSRTWWAITTVFAAWGLSNLAKVIVRRARPVLDQPVETVDGFSFPSGHAANTAAMTTTLVILVWPSLRSRWLRVAAISGAVVITGLTAADRVLLGVHYPSDVTAGMLFGVGLVLASYQAYRHWPPPQDPHGTDDQGVNS